MPADFNPPLHGDEEERAPQTTSFSFPFPPPTPSDACDLPSPPVNCLSRLRSSPSPIDMATSESNTILKNLHEKKQNLRRIASEVGSMASELREVRSRMAAQEALLEQETSKRLSAEAKAKGMEKELEVLQKSLQDSNSHSLQSNLLADHELQERTDAQTRLKVAHAAADESPLPANSAQIQYAALLEETEKKNKALQELEMHVTRLSQKLIELQQDLTERETLQRKLKDEVERMEVKIKLTGAEATSTRSNDLRKLLEEFYSRNAEQLAKHVNVNNEEFARLKEEIKLSSAQFKFKSQELEVQLDKQRRVDQELKKRILKLEFWLQEARSQTRKLQRAAEKKDKEIKDLQAQLWLKETNPVNTKWGFEFWDNFKLKVLLSLSAVVLAFLAKR